LGVWGWVCGGGGVGGWGRPPPPNPQTPNPQSPIPNPHFSIKKRKNKFNNFILTINLNFISFYLYSL